MSGILISIVLILVIVILAGYILNSLGPTIFKTKQAVDQAVDQFGKEIEKQNAETDVENLLKKIKNDQDLSGLNLSGLDLTGYDLSGKNLSNVKFNQSDLTDVDFTNSNLNGADFSGAKILNTDFSNMDLRSTIGIHGSANFHGADLSGLKLLRTGFVNSDFTNADLSDGLWLGGSLEGKMPKGYHSNCSKGAGISGSSYTITFANNDLTNADLSGTRLECYKMGGNTFSNTNFKNTVLHHVKLGDDYLKVGEMKGVTIGGHSLVSSNSQHIQALKFFDSIGCNITPHWNDIRSSNWIFGTC